MEEFIHASGKGLETILDNSSDTRLSEDMIVATSQRLNNVCSNTDSENLSVEHFVEQFNNVVGNSNWMPWVDKGKGEICLFQFGSSQEEKNRKTPLRILKKHDLIINRSLNYLTSQGSRQKN